MKVFYHNDPDGLACAACVFYGMGYHKGGIFKGEFFPLDYDVRFPIDSIKRNELVYLLDYSIQEPGVFQQLKKKTNKLVWIDHHKTAIQSPDNTPDIAGVRDANNGAACLLTWKYLYPDWKVPAIIELISDWDSWKWKEKGRDGYKSVFVVSALPLWIDEIKDAQTGLDGRIRAIAQMFTSRKTLLAELETGELIYNYRQIANRELIQRIGFETNFEGHRCFCVNASSMSSLDFERLNSDYDIFITFSFSGRGNCWVVSLYSHKVDVSKIAKKYGGGGHTGAAGFEIDGKSNIVQFLLSGKVN